MADDDVVEIVVPKTAEPDKKTTAEPPKSETTTPEDAVAVLKKQLADKDAENKAIRESEERSRRAAIDAENRARAESARAHEHEKVVHTAELESVSNALAAANHEMQGLEDKLKAAHEAGEYGTVAKLNAQMSKVGAKITSLEDGKSALEERAKQQPTKPQPKSAEEKREAYIATRTAPTAAWLRAHPQFFSDDGFRDKVTAADGYVANILGIPRDSPEYFAKIEETVGLRHAPEAAASAAAVTVDRQPSTEQRQPAAAAKPATPAAPPSRTAPEAGPDLQGTRVALTREEREAARFLFPQQKAGDPDPEQLYASHKLALLKEGRYFGTDGRPVGIR